MAGAALGKALRLFGQGETRPVHTNITAAWRSGKSQPKSGTVMQKAEGGK